MQKLLTAIDYSCRQSTSKAGYAELNLELSKRLFAQIYRIIAM